MHPQRIAQNGPDKVEVVNGMNRDVDPFYQACNLPDAGWVGNSGFGHGLCQSLPSGTRRDSTTPLESARFVNALPALKRLCELIA